MTKFYLWLFCFRFVIRKVLDWTVQCFVKKIEIIWSLPYLWIIVSWKSLFYIFKKIGRIIFGYRARHGRKNPSDSTHAKGNCPYINDPTSKTVYFFWIMAMPLTGNKKLNIFHHYHLSNWWKVYDAMSKWMWRFDDDHILRPHENWQTMNRESN